MLRERNVKDAFDAQQQLNPREAVETELPIQIGVQRHPWIAPAGLELVAQVANQIKQSTSSSYADGILASLSFFDHVMNRFLHRLSIHSRRHASRRAHSLVNACSRSLARRKSSMNS